MRYRDSFFALLAAWIAALCAPAVAAEPSASDREADFRQFCEFVGSEYAYFDIKATDWLATCNTLRPQAIAAKTRDEFVSTLEAALGQLYDSHAHLGTNTPASLRLVPTGSQLRLAWQASRAMITDVRQGSAAEKAGIHTGDELLALDDVAIAKLAAEVEPRHLLRADPLARDWALNVSVAGRHQRATRKLQIRSAAGIRTLEINAEGTGEQQGLLESRRIGRVGYVRIHNSLGDTELVTAFDNALQEFADASGLILDLRDTPSGGTSSVARGLMGHFVRSPTPYQRHEYVAEGRETGVPRIWMEYVSPRLPLRDAPVVVLVGAWTGSMGEGIAIGLNGAREAVVLGQRMAQLVGALGEVRLVHSGILVRVPNEKLFHVNGTPRERFMPQAASFTPGSDATLEAALRLFLNP